MLDQNTDRMWYVIGAVIIGAAIILILNNTFPQLFASIGNTFNDKTEDVSKDVDELTMTDGVGPIARGEKMMFNMKTINIWNTNMPSEWLSDTSVKLSTTPTNLWGGVAIDGSQFEMGETYTIEFDIQKVSGEVKGIGGHLHMSDQADVTIDGRKTTAWANGSPHSVDINQWAKAVNYPDDTAEHHVRLTFTKDYLANGANPRVYIQINRSGNTIDYMTQGLSYEVILSNIELYHHE